MSDLQHYLDTGEVPDDLETLNRLYQEAIGGEATAAASNEQAESGAKATESAAAGAEGVKGNDDQKPDGEKEPDGILTKDGKHVISYDVLKTEREQRQQAIREAQELRDEVERLKNGTQAQQAMALSSMTEEQLAELKEYFPAQYEAIVSQQASIQAAQQKLASYEQQEAKRQAEAAQKVALNVQEEIDNNPTLSHWQRNEPDVWAKCVDLDNQLRADPKTASLSMTERFEKVARAMSQIYGSPIKEAETTTPPSPAPKTPGKAAASAKPPINSLSDIPGGEAPEASEQSRIEDMDSVELGNMLMKMTPEQQTAFLNRIG